MKVFVGVALLLLLSLTEGLNVIKIFKDNQVSPDVVTNPPTKKLEVTYTKSGKLVALGNELAPKDVREKPLVTIPGEVGCFYTLIMSDPDAPSRKTPTKREWQHWLVVNIPGMDLEKGETLSEYIGSGPPKNSGLHRYVFVVFKQTGKLTFNETKHLSTDANRANFNTMQFVKKYNLGEPIAGNFFQAQYDDTVPDLYKTFKN